MTRRQRAVLEAMASDWPYLHSQQADDGGSVWYLENARGDRTDVHRATAFALVNDGTLVELHAYNSVWTITDAGRAAARKG